MFFGRFRTWRGEYGFIKRIEIGNYGDYASDVHGSASEVEKVGFRAIPPYGKRAMLLVGTAPDTLFMSHSPLLTEPRRCPAAAERRPHRNGGLPWGFVVFTETTHRRR